MILKPDAVAAMAELTPAGDDRFTATRNLDLGGPVVYGGQILAQSVLAARTVEAGKAVKTLHTIFPRPGAIDKPVDIAVERIHSGRALATMTLTFSQEGRVFARSMVLLSADEPDLIRHVDQGTPGTPPAPEFEGDGGAWHTVLADGADINDPEQVGPPDLDVWSRWSDVPADPATSQALLALATEGYLIGTAMRPHAGVGQAQAHRTLSTGVVSHTITFHQPCDVSAWVLQRQHSSFAGGGRAFGRGDVFTQGGELVATYIQDSMIRAMAPSRTGGL